MDAKENGSIHLPNPAAGTDRRHKGEKAEPCKGCFYYGGKAKSVKCCNYFLITGRRRPCETGDVCTVRLDSKKARRKSMKIKNNR